MDAERDGVEVARVGDGQQFVDVLASQLEQAVASIFGQPAGEAERRLTGIETELRIFLAP